MQCKHYFHWKRSKISKQQPLLCVHWFVSYRETPFFFCLGWDILRRSQKNLLPLCDVSMSDQATSYRLAENPHCIRYSWSSVETGILCSSQKATIYFQRFASAGLSGCQLPSNRVWETLGSRKEKNKRNSSRRRKHRAWSVHRTNSEDNVACTNQFGVEAIKL